MSKTIITNPVIWASLRCQCHSGGRRILHGQHKHAFDAGLSAHALC